MPTYAGECVCREGVLDTYLIIIYSDMRCQRILKWAPNVVRHTGIRNPIVSGRIPALLGCKLSAYPAKQTGDLLSPCFGYPELRSSSSRVPGSQWSYWDPWPSEPSAGSVPFTLHRKVRVTYLYPQVQLWGIGHRASVLANSSHLPPSKADRATGRLQGQGQFARLRPHSLLPCDSALSSFSAYGPRLLASERCWWLEPGLKVHQGQLQGMAVSVVTSHFTNWGEFVGEDGECLCTPTD